MSPPEDSDRAEIYVEVRGEKNVLRNFFAFMCMIEIGD